jgi:hypothetical protein
VAAISTERSGSNKEPPVCPEPRNSSANLGSGPSLKKVKTHHNIHLSIIHNNPMDTKECKYGKECYRVNEQHMKDCHKNDDYKRTLRCYYCKQQTTHIIHYNNGNDSSGYWRCFTCGEVFNQATSTTFSLRSAH